MRKDTLWPGPMRRAGLMLRTLFAGRPRQVPYAMWDDLLFYARNFPTPGAWRGFAIRVGAEYGFTERQMEALGLIDKKPVTATEVAEGKKP